ncbi:hypothetical protein [Bacillus swezeyi]
MTGLFQGAETPGVSSPHDADQILSSARAEIPPEVLNRITEALSNSIVHTFTWAILPASAAFLLVFFMPKDRVKVNVKSK